MQLFHKIFGKKKNEVDLFSKTIAQSVDIFFTYYQEPGKIKAEIKKIAKSDQEEMMLFLFIPHIFCRLTFPEVEWTDYFICPNDNGEEIEMKFSDSNIYSKMYTTIKNNWDEYLSRDIGMVLFHSGDFKAINQMLNNGSKLENLSALPPKISTR
ncbi:hypothetical protein [Pedobacter gandavensis]|uniref:Uncharacterized protein n=1 Tax=Pedobacter gandavensis TaxID=2679963 RepID=A0ABR6EZP6_9SPHI|nr:hypothetical protein [Pedobacter gandavensis]MBB2150726.1 hypothetical protein [Pedobacter gandavensis]